MWYFPDLGLSAGFACAPNVGYRAGRSGSSRRHALLKTSGFSVRGPSSPAARWAIRSPLVAMALVVPFFVALSPLKKASPPPLPVATSSPVSSWLVPTPFLRRRGRCARWRVSTSRWMFVTQSTAYKSGLSESNFQRGASGGIVSVCLQAAPRLNSHARGYRKGGRVRISREGQ